MPRRIALPIVLCALIPSTALAVVAASAGADSVAHAAKACKSASAGPLRGGYYLNLRVNGAGCATGRGVQGAWQSCRTKHGLGGRCHAKVLGFGCHEQRNSIPTQITASVSCRRAGKTVSYSYQQNLA